MKQVKISDDQTGEGLPFASAELIDSLGQPLNQGEIADEAGIVNIPDTWLSSGAKVAFTFAGFDTEVYPASSLPAEISLSPSGSLEEVTVIGYVKKNKNTFIAIAGILIIAVAAWYYFKNKKTLLQ